MRAGARKQAHVPRGRRRAGAGRHGAGAARVGAAPLVAVLPGPPRELQTMWAAAVETSPLRELLASAGTLEQRILRFFPLPEPQIAATLRELDADALPLEVTTCLRRGELEVATVFRSERAAAYASLRGGAARAPRRRPVLRRRRDDRRGRRAAARGPTIATAESCTGGLMAGRLTDLAGSSAYVLGGLVVYSNEAKTALAGVPASLIEAHGAVSPEVATALAAGARARLGADLGIGITGIAGPGGGYAGQAGRHRLPVGLRAPTDAEERTVRLPGRPRRRPRPHDHRRAAHAPRPAPARMTGRGDPAPPRPVGVAAPTARRAPGTLAAPPTTAARTPSPTRGARPLRLFVALDLPDAARDALAALDAAATPTSGAPSARGAPRHARLPRRSPAVRRRPHRADRRRRGRRARAAPRARRRPAAPAAPRARPHGRAEDATGADRAAGPRRRRARTPPASTRPRSARSARTSRSPGCDRAPDRRAPPSCASIGSIHRRGGDALRRPVCIPAARATSRWHVPRCAEATATFSLHGRRRGPEGHPSCAARPCRAPRPPERRRGRAKWRSCVDFRGVRCATLTCRSTARARSGHDPAADRPRRPHVRADADVPLGRPRQRRAERDARRRLRRSRSSSAASG